MLDQLHSLKMRFSTIVGAVDGADGGLVWMVMTGGGRGWRGTAGQYLIQ